jgi:hypothetical protein
VRIVQVQSGNGQLVTHFELDNRWTFSAAAIGYGLYHLAVWPTSAARWKGGARDGFEHLLFEASQDEVLKHLAETAARPVCRNTGKVRRDSRVTP